MQRRDLMKFTVLNLLTSARVGAAPTSVPSPVVLELFTSQGCSSCPPADALLGEMVHRPGVIGLAWHVDYWNGLGWRDPFARPEWTERQKAYARRLGAEVFTPALVVNGAALVIGSDRNAVEAAIGNAARAPVAVRLRRTSAGLEAETDQLSEGVTGLLVTYDPEHSTEVGAGENSGRRLKEYRAVRDVASLANLTSRVSFPPVAPDLGVALLLRDASWRIVGAAELPPRAAA
jgi:hypothetical protein